jgi:hypothetical protein
VCPVPLSGIEWGIAKLPISKLGLAGKCLILLTGIYWIHGGERYC